MKMLSVAVALVTVAASAAVPFKNGTRFALNDVPGELVVERRAGEPVRFALEENGTTGYLWAAEWNTNECEVVLDHRGAAARNERGEMLCGAAGTLWARSGKGSDLITTVNCHSRSCLWYNFRHEKLSRQCS